MLKSSGACTHRTFKGLNPAQWVNTGKKRTPIIH